MAYIHNKNLTEQSHTIIHGNCLDHLARLPRESVDLIFADPPYNLQLKDDLSRPDGSHVDAVTNDWDQFDSYKAYDKFTKKWLRACRRVLKNDGALWVVGSYHNIYRVGGLLQDLGYWILNDVSWVKHNPMPNFRGRRFTNAHETLLWCAKSPSSRYTFNYQAMKALNDGRQMRSDWYLPICNGHERIKDSTGKKLHPTQKPESLIRRIIHATSNQNDLVLDPFSGSGTTVSVAKSLRRRAIGIEQEESYIEHSRERVANTEVLPSHVIDTVKPPNQQTRIPFGQLVESGILTPGTKVESSDKLHSAEITSEGLLTTGSQKGSIHSLGAELTKAPSCNGWNFWHVRAEGQKRVALDTFRQYLRQQLDSESLAPLSEEPGQSAVQLS